eukprot:TRINITY_DN2122_c0_g1_i1.p2 TRINITY_DN2122_c0_g1~~TRINITY_DN2122_c0_g1_i1.p2  ORF type:complete len:109 (-),score=5.48 TRINITY_DN2122_c0_g1_i1:433-759(-)
MSLYKYQRTDFQKIKKALPRHEKDSRNDISSASKRKRYQHSTSKPNALGSANKSALITDMSLSYVKVTFMLILEHQFTSPFNLQRTQSLGIQSLDFSPSEHQRNGDVN